MPFLQSRPRLLLLALFALAVLAACLGLASGTIAIPLGHLPRALAGSDPEESAVIVQLRLPRVLLGLLVGAALGQAGAAMQALFRNPLAEPGLIGVSAGAALSAAIVLTTLQNAHVASWSPFLLPVSAFVGGLAATWAVVQLGRSQGLTRMSTLLLAGAAVNAFVAAATGLLATLASDTSLRGFTLWMFGSLGRAGWTEIACTAPLILLPLFWLPRQARALDALLLGEAEAAHLGVAVERLKRRVLLLAVLATGGAVALAGLIGFVGLLVPHALRLLGGPEHRSVLPGSALLGGALLCLADAAARSAAPPTELPVGLLTALLGAPFFLALLMRGRGRAELL